MNETPQKVDEPVEIEQFSPRTLLFEIVSGVGITVGLALLWLLEGVRDGYFGLLDRLNFKARRRRASAFPPGLPQRLTAAR